MILLHKICDFNKAIIRTKLYKNNWMVADYSSFPNDNSNEEKLTISCPVLNECLQINMDNKSGKRMEVKYQKIGSLL